MGSTNADRKPLLPDTEGDRAHQLSTIALREWLLEECPSGRGAVIVVDAINTIERLENENAELLEAARIAVRWADDMDPVDSAGSEWTGEWLSTTGREAIEGLRAAIAKAEGK